MELKTLKKSCIGLVLALSLGIFPANVFAEEVIVVSDTGQNVIEAREMMPGDVATEYDGADPAIIRTNELFSPRLTAPESGNPYYFDYNSYYLSGYGMPNCTAYAYGRAYEILGSKPNLCMGNANQWWDYNLSRGYYESGSTPEVGAVICWGGGECGHVAVVEKIEGNTVTYSESTWSGVYFQTRTYTIGNEDNVSLGDFQGYIYLGDFTNEEDESADNGEDVVSDTSAPLISNLVISNVDDSGFTVSCNVSDDESGIERVLFPTWTENNDQDDLIWYVANVVDGIASKRISFAEHNDERGIYLVHAYTYNTQNLLSVLGTSIAIPQGTVDVSYRTHVQDFGWQDWKTNGDLSGTMGEGKRLEGIEISLDAQGYDLGIAYSTHIENIGWQDYRTNGVMSGTEGRGLRLEAIRIELTGTDAKLFDVYYRVHAQNVGWLDWASNGADSGTAGFGYRLESIEVRVVPKGSAAPGETAKAYIQSL
ncbi:GBS Bsp-like repeat-containing protein [Eubacteriaceae bacterium ES3]|nr:GBS Bsp-like repeat-containing protein [Eubacteriaceae bacterium ES3]